MKKRNFLIIAALCVAALAIWFSCNPFQAESDSASSLNVMDVDSSARLSISCTIVVNGGTWNGGGQTINQTGLGDGGQGESQSPVLTVANGTITNFTIAAPAADGMHFMGGSATISSVSVPDIGEDVVSVKKPGTYTVSNCSFANGEDKTMQINDLCTITENSVTANSSSKFMRQNGGKTWKMTSYCNNSTVNNMSECVFRSDASSSIFYYHNLSTNCSRIAYDGTTHVQAN